MKKSTIFILMGILYLLGVGLYSYYNYELEKDEFSEYTNKQLGWSASGGALLLGANYHSANMDKNITEESYIEHARILSKFNEEMQTDYIYSFIKKGEKVFYAATSYKPDEWDNAYEKDFFSEYEEATDLLKSSFTSKEIGYEISSDSFGSFKSILVPLTAEDGTVYVMGADLEISHIDAKLFENLIRSILVGVYFLLLLVPILLLYSRVVVKDREMLKQKIKDRTAELNSTNLFLNNISSQLSRYLSPQIKDMIFKGEGNQEIKSVRKKLTIYFSDIKNFTVTTANMEPEELTNILNSYFDAMNTIAIKYGGTIDKYIGDAILIFTGDPETRGEKEDALACVSMAIEMRETILELQKKWAKDGHTQVFKVRAGINTGHVTVGNFGSHQRMDYTIIGSQVNIAARLESLAEEDTILISHETYSLIKDKIECEKHEEVTLKGISWPVQTYKVIGYADEKKYNVYDIDDDGVSIFVNMNKVALEYKEKLESKIKEVDAIIKDSLNSKK